MSDIDPLDQLARDALERERRLEPTREQVRAVVTRARAQHARRHRARRLVIAVAGALLLATGTALALPQTREAITNAFGAFGDFFTGGDPPGTPIPEAEQGQLNWFRGTDTTTGSIVAKQGGVRLVAYRERSTGMACL